MLLAAIGSLAFAHDAATGAKQPAHHALAAHDGHAAALGEPGNAGDVNRTIRVVMDDTMRFRPATIRVERGETIRFEVANAGKLRHEMVLGTMKELTTHAALMRKFPEMAHADPNQASVDPGKSGELIWRFTRGGTVEFACLQPGHFEAGMKGRVVVVRAKGAAAVKATPPAKAAHAH